MRALINVEGNCAPVNAEEVTKIFSKVPLLSVWGDNSEGAPGPNGDERRNGCVATVNALKAVGGTGKFLLLPEVGQKGNSHMLMMDKNNLADRRPGDRLDQRDAEIAPRAVRHQGGGYGRKRTNHTLSDPWRPHLRS